MQPCGGISVERAGVMKIIDSGTVFSGTEGTKTCGNYIPTVLAMSSGEVLVFFRATSEKTAPDANIGVCISADKGKTFTQAAFPFGCVYSGIKGSLWSAYPAELDDGVITACVFWTDRQTLGDAPFVNPKTFGLLPVKTLLYKSYDFGRSWRFEGEIEKEPYTCELPVTCHIYKFPDGTLMCPFENYKTYYDDSKWKQAAVVKFSYDGGKSWPGHASTAHDENIRLWYNDQRGCVLNSGRFINYYPTFDTRINEYINVYTNNSADMGKTWTRPIDTGIAGMPSAPVELADGRVLVATSDQKTRTVDLYVSSNGGESFDEEKLTIYTAETQTGKTGDKNYNVWIDWSFGRPQITKTGDSELFVVYYAGRGKCTDIKWALCSI